MYRSNGELRFGVGWLSAAMSRVNLIPAKPPQNAGDEPQPLDIGTAEAPGADWDLREAAQLVVDIAGGPVGQGQLLAGVTVHMMVPGLCYILATVDESTDTFSTWSVLSQDEVRAQQGATSATGEPVFERQVGPDEWQTIPDADILIKVWRQDRQYSWLPDSPVRSVLDSLDEIKLCTDHIHATGQQRLTGAGLLIIPSEVQFPPPPPLPDGSLDPRSPLEGFVDSLIDVAEVARQDQSSAAARIPIPITVPGEWADGVRHVTFGTPFDTMVLDIRASAIRRFALGVELPPEVVMGMGDVNHWGARQIEEAAITLQIEPMAELPCHALTIGYLKPALQALGRDPDEIIVWYDTSDLRARPDRTPAATDAYRMRALSRAAYLRETGLSEEDAPDDDEWERRVLEDIAVANGALAPQALRLLGIEVEDPAPAVVAPPVEDEAESDEDDAPPVGDAPPRDTPPDDGDAPETQQAAALLAACDGLVVRALEKAGARLRSAAGKGQAGGAASVACPDPALFHTQVDATRAGVALDTLLAGSWDRARLVAGRFGLAPDELTDVLNTYARALIATGHAHDYDRLADALDGLHATVG
jgi:hypothetical protein